MGFTKIKANVIHPTQPDGSLEVELLVDTGATFSTIPRAILERLNIPATVVQDFTMADGRNIQKGMGAAILEVQGIKAIAPVIFGEPSDIALLGVTALEALGFEVDPTTRSLKQVPLIQASFHLLEKERGRVRILMASQDNPHLNPLPSPLPFGERVWVRARAGEWVGERVAVGKWGRFTFPSPPPVSGGDDMESRAVKGEVTDGRGQADLTNFIHPNPQIPLNPSLRPASRSSESPRRNQRTIALGPVAFSNGEYLGSDGSIGRLLCGGQS